ncbi:hypothetical protein [Nonlabens sp.]|uniref:hypothetical protein n=1 Tax=Nonlabens sp. TaxID=1888209 RepID=UPI00321C2544
MPQKLSPAARKKKSARDLAYAKTPRRRAMKAETQKKRRDALKKGINIKGKDWDHNKKKFVSVAANRGGHGKGTKKYNTK